MFRECDSLLFIGAAGIAVRAIAPFVASKASDPAVLVMDEQGHFVISLLSGHLGGANALTREIAALVGAVPVITTATDAGGRFSVDDFARRENMHLDSLSLAKEVAADILEQRTIGLYSDFEVVGQIPPELSIQKKDGLGISISVDETYNPFPRTLHLVPRIAVLGIGCKKGYACGAHRSAGGTGALAESAFETGHCQGGFHRFEKRRAGASGFLCCLEAAVSDLYGRGA